MLAWAAMLGDAESVRTLIEHGADPNRRNRDGSTPLHGAAFFGYPTVAQILIARGADTNARNQAGSTPYDAASADEETTRFLTGLLRLPPRPQEERQIGRRMCQQMLPFDSESQRNAQTKRPMILRDCEKPMLRCCSGKGGLFTWATPPFI
jgi:ankyrin repeat protein